MDTSSIATQVRAIAALSEHMDSAPPDVGVLDALIAARTLVEIVQDRCFARGQDEIALMLEPVTSIIDASLGRL